MIKFEVPGNPGTRNMATILLTEEREQGSRCSELGEMVNKCMNLKMPELLEFYMAEFIKRKTCIQCTTQLTPVPVESHMYVLRSAMI